MDIAELLAFSVKNKASDLHLSAGLPPVIRVDFSNDIVKPKPIAASFTTYLEYLVNSSDITGFPDETFDEAELSQQDDIINF